MMAATCTAHFDALTPSNRQQLRHRPIVRILAHGCKQFGCSIHIFMILQATSILITCGWLLTCKLVSRVTLNNLALNLQQFNSRQTTHGFVKRYRRFASQGHVLSHDQTV